MLNKYTYTYNMNVNIYNIYYYTYDRFEPLAIVIKVHRLSFRDKKRYTYTIIYQCVLLRSHSSGYAYWSK